LTMQVIINIIALSSFYLLFSVGLALVFGVMRVINFAHGELYMLGGYMLWVILTLFTGLLPGSVIFALALILGPLIVFWIGVLLERIIFRPLRVNPLGGFLASLGLSYILQVVVLKSFGVASKTLPTIFSGNIELLGGILPIQRFIVIVFSLFMMAGLWYFLMRTRIGRAFRAISQNSEAAALQGISISKMSMLSMGVGASLAAISGCLIASVANIGPFMGLEAIWKAFIIVIVGGLGSIEGAVLAAVLFGLLENTLMIVGLHEYVAMIDSLVMLLVLAFKPVGLLGRES
jgi:branched-chain amino acid transport system permease protein